MSELEQIILSKVDKIDEDVSAIKVAVSKNTKDLEYHIKRTDDLQVVVENFSSLISPLHEAHIAQKAIENYKKNKRETFLYSLKIPGAILSALAALAGLITWLMNR